MDLGRQLRGTDAIAEEECMSMDQLAFYQQKLEYEIDSWDLYEALQSQSELGTDVVVVPKLR